MNTQKPMAENRESRPKCISSGLSFCSYDCYQHSVRPISRGVNQDTTPTPKRAFKIVGVRWGDIERDERAGTADLGLRLTETKQLMAILHRRAKTTARQHNDTPRLSLSHRAPALSRRVGSGKLATAR